MTKQVDRSAKLNRKLRASETERVRLVRELDRARKQVKYLGGVIGRLEMEIKKLKREAGR